MLVRKAIASSPYLHSAFYLREIAREITTHNGRVSVKAYLKNWQLTAALIAGLGIFAVPVYAQTAAPDSRHRDPVSDHLKCFDIDFDHHGHDDITSSSSRKDTVPVLLKTEFGKEYCDVTKQPDALCVEASKKRLDNYRGGDSYGGYDAGDFLCHKIECKAAGRDDKGQKVEASDQFSDYNKPFKFKLGDAFALCAPADVSADDGDDGHGHGH
jgi:hypothetical protein